MKLALVTTPPSVRSGIGDYTRHLLPHLVRHCDVSVFVEPKHAGEPLAGLETRRADTLVPRDFDQVLYQLGNERSHVFMPRMVRALGGTVVLHDWVLFDLALAAFPALARGGVKGHALALREGGPGELAVYARNWRARRRQRLEREARVATENLAGTLLAGWHAAQSDGRWTSDVAVVRLPAQAVERVRVSFVTEPDRRFVVSGPGGASAAFDAHAGESAGELELALSGARTPEITLETEGITVSEEQRRHGDTRRLGTFVRQIAYQDRSGWQELDLSVTPARPLQTVYLTRDRFELALNRSVVRFADAFLVHSEAMRARILAERNAPTPIGVVHHGAEPRWHDGDRRAPRTTLGLPDAWRDAFLVTSFGALQAHKRVDKLLAALALARQQRTQIRLTLIGRLEPEDFDAVACARELAIEDAVHFTGHVPEERAWEHIHAGDLAVQLRGPSTGGASGGVFQSLALGRGVVVSEAAGVPPECCPAVPPDENEVQRLAALLVALHDDPQRRAAMERAARHFVESECAWSHVAERYAEHLARFPRPRAARRSLFAMKLEAARRRRRAKDESDSSTVRRQEVRPK
jgi:glycosyltransferase involved in cell wall biosynthesis